MKLSSFLHIPNSAWNLPIKTWLILQPEVWRIAHLKKQEKLNEVLEGYFKGKSGICIGGQLRWKFQDFLKQAKKVVNVDIVSEYSGQLVKPDFIRDAASLDFASNGEFDFVCSSHVLEHLTNPIKAILEWKRVLRKGGVLYCGVPDKRFTFDHKRQRTPITHLINDYEKNIGLKDRTHLFDAAFNTDFRLVDIEPKEFFNRCIRYAAENETKVGSLQPHHHIYQKKDVLNLFSFLGFSPVFYALIGYEIFFIGVPTP